VVLAAFIASGLGAQAAPAERDLQHGITQLREGDLEGAVVALTSVIRDLSGDPARAKELAQAHLHLGVAYAQLDDEKAARASFREALSRDPGIELDPQLASAKVQRVFEEARTNRTLAAPATSRGPAATSGVPLLGVRFVAVTDDLKARSGTQLDGSLVTMISPEGPAAVAGIRPGDVIRGVGSDSVRGPGDLTSALEKWQPGAVVPIEIWRGGEFLRVTARLEDALAFLEPRCTKGAAENCYELGMLYLRGRGVPEDKVRAAGLFQKACDAGALAGCTALGWAYATGAGMAKDAAKAAQLYQSACDAGELSACAHLGLARFTGQGVAQDESAALALFQKACDGMIALGCGHLAWAYDVGRGLPRDDTKASLLYEKACAWGWTWACGPLGSMYAAGRGVARDDAKAVAFLQRACDGSETSGCSQLGWMYAEGRGVAKDDGKAAGLYQTSCTAGDLKGCFLLGHACASGIGATKDDAKAASLYNKACDGGVREACGSFGVMLAEGRGVAKDEPRARSLFQKACAGGDAGACDQLGRWASPPSFRYRTQYVKFGAPEGTLTGDALGLQYVGEKGQLGPSVMWTDVKSVCFTKDSIGYRSVHFLSGSGKKYRFYAMVRNNDGLAVVTNIIQSLLDSKASGFKGLAAADLQMECPRK
jgi:hypothetical protein